MPACLKKDAKSPSRTKSSKKIQKDDSISRWDQPFFRLPLIALSVPALGPMAAWPVAHFQCGRAYTSGHHHRTLYGAAIMSQVRRPALLLSMVGDGRASRSNLNRRTPLDAADHSAKTDARISTNERSDRPSALSCSESARFSSASVIRANTPVWSISCLCTRSPAIFAASFNPLMAASRSGLKVPVASPFRSYAGSPRIDKSITCFSRRMIHSSVRAARVIPISLALASLSARSLMISRTRASMDGFLQSLLAFAGL